MWMGNMSILSEVLENLLIFGLSFAKLFNEKFVTRRKTKESSTLLIFKCGFFIVYKNLSFFFFAMLSNLFCINSVDKEDRNEIAFVWARGPKD